MGLILVTKGYLWMSILILALWIRLRGYPGLSPTVALNIERVLAIALGLGVGLVGFAAFADLFPPLIPGFIPDYVGL